MKRKGWFILGLLLVIAVAGFFGYQAYAAKQITTQTAVQTATVQRGSLAATLSSSGNVRSGQSATIAWQTSGKVG